MASLETFESTLKEVVQAKRLSSSKMEKLKDIALKCMENDTQLVSILYRRHKGLSNTAKIHSLYAFDALARAARHQVVKRGLTGDINSERGNCATFLLKVEGVLEGLFQNMLSSGSTEAKEKTQKILDIWTKSSTFQKTVLERLQEVVNNSDKESQPEAAQSSVVDPRTSAPAPSALPVVLSPPVQIPTEPTQLPSDVQSTLFALLQAAAANNGQTVPNTNQPPKPLDASSLALFQQFTAKAASPPLPFSPPIPPPNGAISPHGVSNHHPPYRDDRYDSGSREPRYRSNSRDHGRDREGPYNDWNNSRGGFRGGYRGRGRGDGRGRWDERDRYRDGGFSPPSTSGRSRSRSPRRYGGRRDPRPYSPPRRPPLPSKASHTPEAGPPSSLPRELDKDEFGRDIRPQSPDTTVPVDPRTQPPRPPPPVAAAAAPAATVDPAPALANNQIPMSQQSPSVAANTFSQTPNAPSDAVSSSAKPKPKLAGLDTFDRAAFDFTSSSAWEALGNMWVAEYAYMPSQEELMQFVMYGVRPGAAPGTAPAAPTPALAPVPAHIPAPIHAPAGAPIPVLSETGQTSQWQGASGQSNGAWNGGGGRGRGGFSRGNGRGGYSNGWGDNRNGSSYENTSDAIVLGGGDDMDIEGNGVKPADIDKSKHAAEQTPSATYTPGMVGAGGRMQRVGDRWVFVRGDAQPGVA